MCNIHSKRYPQILINNKIKENFPDIYFLHVGALPDRPNFSKNLGRLKWGAQNISFMPLEVPFNTILMLVPPSFGIKKNCVKLCIYPGSMHPL